MGNSSRLYELHLQAYVYVRWKRPCTRLWHSVRGREWREGRHLLPAMNKAAHARLVELLELVERHVPNDDYMLQDPLDPRYNVDDPFQPQYACLIREANKCALHYASIDTKVRRKQGDGRQFFVARQLARQLRGVHERMEGARRYALNQWGTNPAVVGDWTCEWEKHRSKALREDIDSFFAALGELRDAETKREWLVHLGYELQRHCSEYSESELALIERQLVGLGLNLADCRAPAWFVPECDLRLLYYRDTWEYADHIPDWIGKASKAVAGVRFSRRGDWMGVHVRATVADDGQSPQFADKVVDWYELSHPSIERLLGACHIGEHYYVCRYNSVTLADFARNRRFNSLMVLLEPWGVLAHIASGLQYLHDHGIAHGHVTLDQITSCNQLFDHPQLTLERWKRPTDARPLLPLNGACASLAELESDLDRFRADIVALGWCAAELLTYRRPSKIRLDQKPPEGVPDDEWRLLQRMCHADSKEAPITIAEVIDECNAFAKKYRASSGGSLGEESRDQQAAESQVDWIVPNTSKLADEVIREIQEALDVVPGEIPGRSGEHGVVARVVDVYDSMQSMADGISAAVVRRFTGILGQIHRKTRRSVAMSSAIVSAFTIDSASARQTGLLEENLMIEIHKSLDEIRDQLALPPDDERHNWRRWWGERHGQANLHAPADATSDAASDEQLTYIIYELTKRRSHYTAAEVRAMQQLLPTSEPVRLRIAQLARIPEWFIAPYDVECTANQLARGSFGVVYPGKWKGRDVVVKKLVLKPGQEARQREAFYRELEIWYHLHHDNVVKLFGACHFGEPFFVCERADLGHVGGGGHVRGDRYPWTHLRDAALGLQYLHANGVVHADLKCNNILCFSQQPVARLCDFGLSIAAAHSGSDGTCVGAWRWKAPEVLRGESATVASDIYSLGMCIIEAVSGEFPWGNTLPDASVKFQVLRKEPPLFPKAFSAAQRELVERMTCFDPAERVTIGSVVAALEWFSKSDLVPDCEKIEELTIDSGAAGTD